MKNDNYRTCQNCGKRFAPNAEFCPYCEGSQTQKPKDKKSAGSKVLYVVFFVLFGFGFLNLMFSNKSDTKSTSWETENNPGKAYVMMQGFVERRLKSPGSAKFPGGYYEEHTESLGDRKYRITSYVDSQNAFGAEIRTYFVGIVEQTSQDEWQLLTLSFK